MRTNRSAGLISFLFKDIHLFGHSNQFIRNADYPAPHWGGGYFEPPPSRFLAISSKPLQVSTAKLAVPSPPTFLHIVLKF